MNDVWDKVDSDKKTEKWVHGYREGQWDVWITNGLIKQRIACPTCKIYGKSPGQRVEQLSWCYDRLHDHLQNFRRKWASVYGGKWDLIIMDKIPEPLIPMDRTVGAREKNEVIMLSDTYPDTPGKRFLQRLKAGGEGSMLKMVDKAMDLPKNIQGQQPRKDSIVDDIDVPF